MKIKSIALFLGLLGSTAVQANGTAPATTAPVAVPQTSAQWLERMTDFTRNASAYRDPKMFVPWANAVTEPGFYTQMGVNMMEPGNWYRMMGSMMDPRSLNNYMQFADPNMYMKWMAASMDPNFYTALMTQFADPGKMMRWMMLPMDPKVWNMGMQAMNPNLYMKWMMTPTDPRAMSLMFAPMNPQLYGSMMGGMFNGQALGPTWGTFMHPAQPVVSVQGAAPVASPINVFDPSTWFNMFNMFGGMPTMPTVSTPFAPVANAQPMPFAVQAGAPATLNLGGDALFKTGKSSVKDLTPEGRAQLDELVAKVKAFGAIDAIRVTGHADKTGTAAGNQKLSLARAKAVAAYLKSKGVKAKTFTTTGLGDTKPVVECDMNQPKEALKACLAPNRRVEIEVTGAKK